MLSTGLVFAQSAINRGPDNEDVPDLPRPGFVVNSNAETLDTGVTLQSRTSVETAASVETTDPSDLIGPEPAVNTESVPDVEPGMVTQREPDPAAAVHEPFMTWELSQFQGAEVRSSTGETIGTVETLAYDRTEHLYLVTDLSGLEPSAGRRAIPLESVGYNPATGDLQVVGTPESVAAMMNYDQVSNGYTELGSDAELRDLTSLGGDPL